MLSPGSRAVRVRAFSAIRILRCAVGLTVTRVNKRQNGQERTAAQESKR